ncbi:hypothetical protein IRZ83_17265 [Flavobacterium sp. JLP]|uniref:hypothetical protein n=1 Tax=unclassified Flavobacterium TaxID=196869 RepID=UPI00188D9ABE|nr:MULTISPECIES: hypothetical protein [unclassified Flavobacterium]MBF4494632.1 hypothetical protein [Flavobacterium sp. MR2016-29]MBF4508431.1 hypothetical protein [Flavobacterium sp. JLP]
MKTEKLKKENKKFDIDKKEVAKLKNQTLQPEVPEEGLETPEDTNKDTAGSSRKCGGDNE